MTLIQNIFRDYAPQYLEKFGARMPAEHAKVTEAILSCRTAACGMTVYKCSGCLIEHHIFRSCGNRNCPTCQNQKALNWMDRQIERSLPGPYFMITFTVPAGIRRILRRHQRIAYNALFKASSAAIKKLAADDKFFGTDMPGFFGILHTWGRTLNYHPHIHYVVPGGAWSMKDKKWHPSRPDFYLPVKALSKIYRAKFRDIMTSSGIDDISPELWHQEWNVNIQAVGDAQHSIRYLSHYVFKVAISDHRIIAVKDDYVTFKYRKPKSRRSRLMKIHAEEFLRRFLQHTLPSGFMKVRYYGFLHPCCSVEIDDIRAAIEIMSRFDITTSKPEKRDTKPLYCPSCGAELKYCYSVLPYQMVPFRDTG